MRQATGKGTDRMIDSDKRHAGPTCLQIFSDVQGTLYYRQTRNLGLMKGDPHYLYQHTGFCVVL